MPLGRLYERVEAELSARGGRVERGARAERVAEVDGGVEVGLAGGVVRADGAVVALPAGRVPGILEGRLRAALERLEGVEHSAIVGIHLRADRAVLSGPHAVLVGCTTQWVFRKDASGRRVHAVISAAPERVLAMSEDALAAMVWADIGACIPGARDARPEWWRVIKSPKATFAATPGFEAVRPAPGPIVEGSRVALAGDYTRTGWPATMEGAARSGQMAAAGLLAGMCVPDGMAGSW